MKIDSHQHFWNYDPKRDVWITDEMKVLKRDFLPGDLHPLLQENGIDGCVSVQAGQSEEETNFLLRLAEEHGFIKGVVGWVDLKGSNLEERLEHFKGRSLLKGFRHIVQAEPDGFMLDKKFIEGVSRLHNFQFTYDILIFEHQLPEAVEFVGKLPEMPLVVDHLAKPVIKEKSFHSWSEYMKRLAEYPHVQVKVSGMVTEADWNHWDKEDFYPYLDVMLENFGPDRLMFGSDWPVCLLAGQYSEVKEAVDSYMKSLSPDEQSRIFGMNAVNFYRLTE